MFFVTRILQKASTPKRFVEAYEALVPSVPFQHQIQRVIFQTTKEKDKLSEPIRENIGRIRQCNPDWEYRLFDDSDIERYILTHYGKAVLAFYHRIDEHYGAAKADFFRYLVVYREGGVYLDIKSTLDQPLSSVIREDDVYVLSYWNNLPGQGHEGFGHYPGLPDSIERGEIIQWYIAAAAGHPLLRRIIIRMLYNIDHYNPYVNGVGWTGTVTTTGPVMYTTEIWNALNEHPDRFPVRWTDIIDTCGFRYSIFALQGENPALPAHTAHLPSDYRKAVAPVIRHRNPVLNRVNQRYIKLLHRLHRTAL